jgi:tetratricopeptide (TPR) repeat protein
MRKIVLLLLAGIVSLGASAQTMCEMEMSKKNYKEYQKACEMYERGQYTASTGILKKIVSDEPEVAEPYFVLGLIAAKKESLAALDKNMSKVLALCPDFPDARLHYYMGLVHYSYERYEQAVISFDNFFGMAEMEMDGRYDTYIEEAESYSYWSRTLAKAYLNPVPFEPKSIQGISTEANEYLAYKTVDGSRMYFTRDVVKNEDNSSFYKHDLETRVAMMIESHREKDGTFGKGRRMQPPFNTGKNEGTFTLTADNKLLFYSITQQTKADYANCDIYFSEYKNGEWTEPQNAGSNVNTASTWESQPSITPDGNYLYFASNRQGGYGGTDIWCVHRLPNGDWSRPENLGPSVNTEDNERSPFIHPDGVSLYFASNGWEGLGGYDMYYTRVDDSRGQKPLNLGHPINTEGDEFYFGVDTDGEKAYFSSNKYPSKGGMDIYEFDLYPAIKPQKVCVIKGSVVDENDNPIGGELELFITAGAKEKSLYRIDDAEGTFTAVLNPKNDYILIAKREGYAFSSVLVTKHTVLPADSILHFKILPIEVGGSYQINDIVFGLNSAELTDNTRLVINAFIEFLRDNPKVHATIEGYTDNVGDEEDNQKLSEQRAKAVYDYLIANRVRPDRLQYKGMGSANPVATNDTEEGRAKNRRTVFVITDN